MAKFDKFYWIFGSKILAIFVTYKNFCAIGELWGILTKFTNFVLKVRFCLLSYQQSDNRLSLWFKHKICLSTWPYLSKLRIYQNFHVFKIKKPLYCSKLHNNYGVEANKKVSYFNDFPCFTEVALNCKLNTDLTIHLSTTIHVQQQHCTKFPSITADRSHHD